MRQSMIVKVTTTNSGFRLIILPPTLGLRSILLVFFSFLMLPVHADDRIDYQKQVKPILAERCVACHGALKQQGGLRLDTAALAIKGGDSGAAITPGDAPASLLLKRVTAADGAERMPPEGEPLKPDQIAAIQKWITQRAEAPANEQPERHPHEHWAFKPPVRSAVPLIAQPTEEQARWQLNPIDVFVSSEHRKHGLTPQLPADKRVWLRRVSLDLIGLPPTPEEVEVFLSDQSPEAHDRVVTRLLESPQYGERWGRHWMDIWRYSDWWGLGAEVRNSQKHIWHWRDWIVESVNSDKGYDQMLREMLAADELYPNDLDRLRATGYLARQYFIFNRTTWLDETIEHTAKGMLGLTFNCAKCHDHKYDPLLQAEYYKLRAIFEPYQIRTEMVPGQSDYEKDGIPRAFDAHLDIPTYLHVRGDDRNPDKNRVLEPAVPAFLSLGGLKLLIEPVALPLEAAQPGLRDSVVKTHRQAAEQQITAARIVLDAAKVTLGESEKAATASGAPAKPELLPVGQAQLTVTVAEKALKTAEAQLASVEARAAADRAKVAQAANLSTLALAASKSERVVAATRAEEDLRRAELALLQTAADQKANSDKKLAATKAALEAANKVITAIKAVDIPSEAYMPLSGAKKTQEDYQNRNADKPFPTSSSGRRSAFAKWLTDPRNPLPARVAVNHIWMRHMGKPLVSTVFDFGRKGTPPTHPELLDWLACELVEHDWSMKHIHRLIVTSQTYRLSSSSAGAADATLAADPENRLYWRMNPVRMEAQVVRDTLLHLAGDLDLSRGGPSIPVSDETSRRRSLYFVHSHNDHQKFLSTFDDASVLDCYRRAESIVPQQALVLENSALATAMATKIAERLAAAHPNSASADFVRTAFAAILTVEPTSAEQSEMSEILSRMTELARAKKRPNPEALARINLLQALLNHNDFITVR
jgi:mono/diheme cytochrome c family protein